MKAEFGQIQVTAAARGQVLHFESDKTVAHQRSESTDFSLLETKITVFSDAVVYLEKEIESKRAPLHMCLLCRSVLCHKCNQ